MEGCLTWENPVGRWLFYVLNELYLAVMEVSAGAKKKERVQSDVALQAERILKEQGNSILRCAYSYLHNMSDAEEILQDVLIQYMKTEPAFQNPQHEKAWLLTVAANLSKNRIKYHRLRETDELKEELASEQREDLSFVWEAVKNLPQTQREVIHLFYQEGFSTKEIAEILQRKEATVRTDLRRARLKLKEILKEEYDFEA